jgi:hypothetical protein
MREDALKRARNPVGVSGIFGSKPACASRQAFREGEWQN